MSGFFIGKYKTTYKPDIILHMPTFVEVNFGNPENYQNIKSTVTDLTMNIRAFVSSFLFVQSEHL